MKIYLHSLIALGVLSFCLWNFNHKEASNSLLSYTGYGNPVRNTPLSGQNVSPGFVNAASDYFTLRVEKWVASGASLHLPGAHLEVPDGAMQTPARLSITALRNRDIPALDQDLVNVTGRYDGYRFLPHGSHFIKPVTISLDYDEAKIPSGYTANDIFTFYFDTDSRHWIPLVRESVDEENKKIISTTTHFTDMINGIIEVPASPAPQVNTPNSMSGIQFPDPGSQIVTIEAPQANSSGNAALEYPIKLPAGRNGMEPSLSVQYSSDGGNGWLGLGWDIGTSSVSIETRWGVPRYDPDLETETYVLNGAQLSPVAHRAVAVGRNNTGDKQFYPRVNTDFEKIIRHGNHPTNYWWEVTDKSGVRRFYGGNPGTGVDASAVLKDANGNIAHWAITEERDPNDNFIKYRYTKVLDAGTLLENTNMGSNLYPASISYTGNGNTEGKYTVVFTRDRELSEPKRKDVIINGRLGFKQVTADLLRKIFVKYNGQNIRSYELTYTEGAFYKTLLQSIKEFDAAGNLFTTHTLDYYDEVRGAGGNYQPLQQTPEDWNAVKDGVRGTFINPIPPFNDAASALSGNKSIGGGFNMAITIGPNNNDLSSKTNTIGVAFGFNVAGNEGLLAMVDINGDGLIDKVFKKDGILYYRANQSAIDSNTTFGDKKMIKGVGNFNQGLNWGVNVGLESNFVLYAGLGYSHSEDITNTYLSDVNGDQLIDIVDNGKVYFNHLDADGNPEFTLSSGDTPSPIQSSSSIDPNLVENDPQVLEKAIDEHPLHDVVKVWIAPFDGTVNVNAPVALIQDLSPTAQTYTANDGVRVAIQHKATELWSAIIPATDFTPKDPTGVGAVAVQKGDRIYFRVQSVFNGAYDQVHWVPEITYSNLDPALTDANGLPVFRFQSDKDFLMSAPLSVGAPFDGTIQITGEFTKPVTSDSVVVTLMKKAKLNNVETILVEHHLNWDQATTVPMATSLQVKKGDQLFFRVFSETNLDWTALQWDPLVFYTASDDPLVPRVLDDDSNPMIKYNPTVDFKAYTKTLHPSIAWETPRLDTFSFDAKPKLNPNFESGQIVFSVKKEKELLAKQVLTVSNGTIDAHPALTVILDSADQVFFDYHSTDTNLVKVMDWDSTKVITTGKHTSKDSTFGGLYTYDNYFIFGPQYRHWGQFSYNGNRDRANQPINEADLHLNEVLLPVNNQDPALNIDLAPLVDTSNVEGSGMQMESSYNAQGGYQPKEDKFIYMAPDNKRKAWIGYDNLTFVTRDTISSSRMGRDDILPVNPITVPGAGPGSGAVGIKKIAQTDNVNVGVASPGGGIGANASGGTTKFAYDFNDMNGDGYPDILSYSKVQYTWPYGGLESQAKNFSFQDVTSATQFSAGGTAGGQLDFAFSPSLFSTQRGSKSSNAAAKSQVSAGVAVNFGANLDFEQAAFLDINGDGLPDRVSRDGKVQLNMGYSFLPSEQWGYGSLTEGRALSFGGGINVNINAYSISAGVSLTRSENLTTHTLLDVNGDGLQDYVESVNPLWVRLNMGNGFGQPIQWAGADAVSSSTSTGESVNIGFTIGISIVPVIPIVKLCFNPSITISQGADRTKVQFEDIDGDGFPDYLRSDDDNSFSAGDSILSVRRSTIRRTNLLKKVTRPLGGSFTMSYERIGNTYDMPNSVWTLSRVDLYDGVPGDGPEFTSKTFAYSDGRYERNEREFYGFGKVFTSDRDTDHENAVYRVEENDYFTDTYYRKGLLKSQSLADSNGNKFGETRYSYQLKNILTGADIPNTFQDDDGAAFPALVSTERLFYEGQAAAGKTTSTSFNYDVLGNMTGTVDYGDPGANDDLSTAVSYHSVPGKYIMNVPSSVTVSGNGQVYRQRATTIDNNTGNITELRQYLQAGGVATYNMTYDGFGNLSTIMRPQNATGQRLSYTYEYDNDVKTYITKTQDAYGYTSLAAYDPRFGEMLSSTDINNQQTQYTLDNAGRILTIREPLEIASGQPFTISFEYHPEAIVPWALAKHFDPAHPANFMETAAFKDGIGREVQTKQDIALFTGAQSPDEEVMVVSGSTTFDAFGRPIVQYYPITEPKGASISVYNPNADAVSPLRMTYDVLDRMLTDTIQDNINVIKTEYGFGSDRNGIQQFQTKSIDANSIYTISYHNSRGLLTSTKKQYSQGSDVWTSYSYNPVDELTQVTDDLNNIITMGYDQLGRKVSDLHPDAGLTSYKYDLAGNLTEKTTAILQSAPAGIKYSYDRERLTKITYPQNPQNNVTLTYGAAGAAFFRAGRLVKQEDGTGSQEFFYNPLGATVKNIRVIKVPDTSILTYTTQWTYDTWNRLTGMVYPDGEVLTYNYNLGGLLQSMSGIKDGITYNYLPKTGYNKFQRRAYMRYGNGTEMTWDFDILFSDLLSRLTATTSTGRYMMDNAYEYDNENNILGIVNSAVKPPSNMMGGSASYQFTYDDLYRVTHATGYFGGSNHEHRYSLDMSYNTVSGILRKTQLHERKAYDDTDWTPQNKTTYDYQYAYNASGQPHAPIHIGREAFTYDANGNQTGWQDDISAQNRQIKWDEENRVQSMSDNGALYKYGYDASGTRVYKNIGSEQTMSINGKKAAQTSGTGNYTIYVNPYQVVYSGGYTKHFFIDGQRIASTLGIMGNGNKQETFQFYYHPDHLGNSAYITNAAGEVYQHVEYFPFGESFVDEHSNDQRTPYLYNGKELEDETGLYYYGARYYDPVTSIWENVDPSWDLPEQVDESPYAYVGNNPVVYFDPDGRVRYLGRGGVFDLLGYNFRKNANTDNKVKGFDWSSATGLYRSGNNGLVLINKAYATQLKSKANTGANKEAIEGAQLTDNNQEKQKPQKFYIKIKLLDKQVFSTKRKDPNAKAKEKQKSYVGSFQYKVVKGLAQTGFLKALGTNMKMRARNSRAK